MELSQEAYCGGAGHLKGTLRNEQMTYIKWKALKANVAIGVFVPCMIKWMFNFVLQGIKGHFHLSSATDRPR